MPFGPQATHFLSPTRPSPGGLLGTAPAAPAYGGGLLGGAAPQGGGFFDRWLSSPLTHLGFGLLSQPSNIGAGLLAGAQSFGGYRQAAQAALERAEAQRQRQAAIGQFVGLLSPDKQPLAAALLSGGESFGDVWGLLNPKDDLTSKMREYQMAVQQGFPGTFMDYQQALQRAGAGSTNISMTVPGTTWKPTTEIGELFFDLENAKQLPPSDSKDRLIASLQEKIASVGLGADASRTQTRMQATQDIADDFNRIADENPNSTGPLGGTITRAQTGPGLLSRATQAISPPTEAQGELAAKEAQMKALLGTALSGAAIPEAEWPTYFAQVPSVTDTPQVRRGKARAYEKMIQSLQDRQRGLQTPSGASQQTIQLAPNQPTGQSTRTIDFSQMRR